MMAGGMACLLATEVPPAQAASFVYTPNGSGSMSGYTLDAISGALSPLAGSPFPVAGSPQGADLHPSGRFLYFVSAGTDTISTRSVHPVTGALASVGAPLSTGGSGPADVRVHPSGRFAFVCNDVSGNVASFTIHPLTGVLSPVAGSPFPAGMRPRALAVDPSGRFLYAANLSSNNVSAYAIDRVTGALTPVPGSPFAVGTSPHGPALDPWGRFLYVPNINSASLSGFSVNESTGSLTPVPGSPFATPFPAGVSVDPSGRYLYATRFVADDVVGFGVDASTGALSPLPHPPSPAGDGPFTLTFDVKGRFVYVSNQTAGTVSAYQVDGSTGALATVSGSPFPAASSTRRAVTGRNFTRGDFNSNGVTDLLWRHDVSGENVAWYMNGTALTTGTFLSPAALVDARWKMVGTHDFNGDRQSDILWRHETAGENVLWYMNGVELASGTFLTPAALTDVRWKMAGTGDFNQDGKPDIAWHHNTSGEVVLWYMNGSVLTGGEFTTPSPLPDIDWRLVGVSDFNEDNRPDLLWHHRTSRQVVLWYMNGAALTSGTFTTPASLPDMGYAISAVGDYNADNRPDIVWRHAVTGGNLVWFMNGATQTGTTPTTPSALTDLDWRLVGPR